MASKRKALGKGLSALISDEFDKIDENSIINISLDLIKSNPLQPRKVFSDDKIEELAQSIKRHGIIQPIIVKKTDDYYQIIAGERRWRASRLAGLKEIPSIVRDISNRSQEELALIENIQRENLNSIDEASAYKVIMNRYILTQDELSDIVGKSRVYVTNLMRLLKLPKFAQQLIVDGKLSTGHGKALIGLGQRELEIVVESVLKKDLNVRDTEKIVREIKEKETNIEKPIKKIKEPNILHIEETLMDEFGTKVEIIKGRKSGKIQLFFSDDEELSRIINIISNKFT